MSDVQRGRGWWLASDGRWYPPESRPQPLPPPPVAAPPGGSGPIPAYQLPAQPDAKRFAASGSMSRRAVSAGLTGTIQGFMWAFLASAVVAVIVAMAALASFNHYWDTPINSRAEDRAYVDWIAMDDGFAAISGLASLVAVVLFILVMVWMNGAHKTTQQLWPGPRQWSSGWTVGAWLIPIANAVLPRLVMIEIERIALHDRANGLVAESWRRRPTLWSGRLWWVGLVVGWAVTVVGNGVASEDDASAGGIRAGYVLSALGFACLAASAVCGAFYIRRVGRRLTDDGLRTEP